MAPVADHEAFMRLALVRAQEALRAGEVPIGAVVVRAGSVLAEGFNQPIRACDPTAHAEIVALRRAAESVGNYRLTDTTLYVTVEPCLMCVGALVHARIATLVYGADEPKGGAVRSVMRVGELALNHRFGVVSGVLAEESRRLMVDFFRSRRDDA
jgi:tRNA(adenine34) deaminase